MIPKPITKSKILIDPFYPTFLWKEALVVVLLITFQRLGQPASIITALGLVMLSLRSSKGAVQALTLVTLLSYLNYFYFPVGFNGAAKWIVLLSASTAGIFHSYRAAKDGPKQDTRWLIPLLLFIVVAGISSAVTSADPEMALFKLFTFSVGALGAMYVLGSVDLSLPYITSWFYTIWVVIVLLSAPLVKFGNGYIANSNFFMGILSHSQAFATFVIPIALYLILRWLVGLKLSIWHKAITLLGLYLVYLSISRTGGFSFLLALIAVAFVYYARGASGAMVRARLIPRLAAVVGVIIILNILTSGSLGELAGVFSHKYGEKMDVMATRSNSVTAAQRTFEKYPLLGKGFGLAMEGESFAIKRDPILRLPISAPVEAGVIYLAAPAQLGIVGTLFLLLFMYIYLAPLFTRGMAPFIGLAAVCFFINFGEYVFFATGGVGMYHWLLYGLAYSVAVRHPEVFHLHRDVVWKEVMICQRTT